MNDLFHLSDAQIAEFLQWAVLAQHTIAAFAPILIACAGLSLIIGARRLFGAFGAAALLCIVTAAIPADMITSSISQLLSLPTPTLVVLVPVGVMLVALIGIGMLRGVAAVFIGVDAANGMAAVLAAAVARVVFAVYTWPFLLVLRLARPGRLRQMP